MNCIRDLQIMWSRISEIKFAHLPSNSDSLKVKHALIKSVYCVRCTPFEILLR
jgi:hypothetical protein